MGIFISWVFLSFVVGAIGSNRKIGFGGAFFLSLIFSPLIGIIITALFKSKSDEEFQQKMLEAQRQNNAQLTHDRLERHLQPVVPDLDEQLRKLKALKDDGLLSESEFEQQRKKLLE